MRLAKHAAVRRANDVQLQIIAWVSYRIHVAGGVDRVTPGGSGAGRGQEGGARISTSFEMQP